MFLPSVRTVLSHFSAPFHLATPGAEPESPSDCCAIESQLQKSDRSKPALEKLIRPKFLNIIVIFVVALPFKNFCKLRKISSLAKGVFESKNY